MMTRWADVRAVADILAGNPIVELTDQKKALFVSPTPPLLPPRTRVQSVLLFHSCEHQGRLQE